MRSILFIVFSLLAFTLPTAAQTYTVDAVPDSETINFNGLSEVNDVAVLVDGLTSSMTYLLESITTNLLDDTKNDWLLQISVSNTSTAPTTANLTALGFDMSDYDSLSFSDEGVYFQGIDADGHFPMGLGSLDVCVTGFNGQCSGGGGGLAEGETDTFYLMLTMSDTITSFTMSDFAVRYQGITNDDFYEESGIGLVTTIPEPATWLMMIIGFGIVSASTRRSRHKASIVHS